VLAASPILTQRLGDTWGHDHYLDHRREQGTWARDGPPLLEIGHIVLIGARDAERGQRTADELGSVFLEIDPTSEASVAAAADQVQNEYGRLDVLVNNAGTAEPRVGAADLTAEEAMKGFGINVFGPIRVTHAFLPLLRASDNPRIPVAMRQRSRRQHPSHSSHGTQQNHHTPQITQPARPITRNAATRCRTASDHKASEGLRMIDRR
jgi:NAD(P)-dependent dehydrogenase (short-subunit alcohol dehydrogenase family)